MTEATADGSSCPASESPDEPPPPAAGGPRAHRFAHSSLLAFLLAPALESNGWPPLGGGTWVAVGLALAFTAALIRNALDKFSPSLLQMRMEKKAEKSESLEEELDDADKCLPTAVLLEFTGLAVALIGAYALLDGATLWPSGWPGPVLLFVLAVLASGVLPAKVTDFRAESIVERTLPVMSVLRLLLLPITAPVAKLAELVVRNVLGIREELENANGHEQLADEIRAAVEDSDETEQLADEEKEWIENIVDFGKEDAAGIMTPRTDMVCVEAGLAFGDAVRIGVDAGHSRLPVFEQKLDNIVGVFYLRDAVGMMAEGKAELLATPVAESMRHPIYVVPESKKVAELLREFRTRRVQIAIVVDEYGGTAGLVSIEDILEEIVGDIEDEYDPERQSPFVADADGRAAEVDAKLRIGELNKKLGSDLPESQDYETIGGFVFSELGRIPRAGESFQYGQLEVTVVSAGERKIERVRIRLLEPA